MIPINIKTGFSPLVESTQEIDLDKINRMLVLFSEKSIILGSHYAKSAGRDNLSGMDTIYALQYFSHEFMHIETLEEDLNALNLNDEDEEQSESEEEYLESDDIFTRVPDTTSDEICKKMNKYHDEWNTWEPTDIIEIILKRNIDKLIIH